MRRHSAADISVHIPPALPRTLPAGRDRAVGEDRRSPKPACHPGRL